MTVEHPDPIDIHVGRRLKLRRMLVGMSQERLGELLGVTFQQIQKYERGANRMGSSRLFAISRILDTPIAWFFDEMDEAPGPSKPASGLSEERSAFRYAPAPRPVPQGRSPVENRETLELVRAFLRIDDPVIRRRLFEVARALAELPEQRPVAEPPFPARNAGEWSLPRSPRSS
ncbi:helix-turn-helix domain-containing protein [Geminicoccus roseus]|uniref:helix-turn-helix domain-containing protein n=1 Tax=Geminicoccus roseus TaxID=404900 RepID=UPI00040FA77A|nr:helix-turn-helix transcriptional regulator [Geminicoccus roseus]